MLIYSGGEDCPKGEILGDILTDEDHVSLLENLMAAPTDRPFTIRADVGRRKLTISASIK